MKYIVLILLSLGLMSCGNSTVTAEDEAQFEKLKNLVESRQFEIDSDWALPQASNSLNQIQNTGLLGPGNTAGSINLIGNPNYLRINGDSIKAQLPFFGERRMGSGHYNDRKGGIELDGLYEDYSAEWNEKKRRYVIKFQAQDKNEQFMVTLNLFPNNNSSMILTGVQRTPIQYTGRVKILDKASKKAAMN